MNPTRILAAAAIIGAGILAAGAQAAHAEPAPFVYTWAASSSSPVTLAVVDVTPDSSLAADLTVEAGRWNAARIPVMLTVTAEPGGSCQPAGTRVPVCREDLTATYPGAFAVTFPTVEDGRHYAGARIVLSTGDPGRWEDGTRMRVLLGHELGHVLGLDHTPAVDPSSIMCPGANTVRYDGTPAAQDYDVLRRIYGTTEPYTAAADHDAAPTQDLTGLAAPDGTVPAWAQDPTPAPTTTTTAAKPAPARRAAPRATPAPAPRPAPVAAPAPPSSSSSPAPVIAGVPGILTTRW